MFKKGQASLEKNRFLLRSFFEIKLFDAQKLQILKAFLDGSALALCTSSKKTATPTAFPKKRKNFWGSCCKSFCPQVLGGKG